MTRSGTDTHLAGRRRVLAAAIALAGLACAVPACFVPAAQAANKAGNMAVEHGRELAVANCARCHAIGNTGESAHPDAPPFRTLSERLDVDTIDEALLTRATPAHSDMPHFRIGIAQATDIAAYIASVQPAAHGRELVELNCSPCHAVGASGDSPHPDAPRFRELSDRYPIEALEEAFVEGIETGHPDMPSFVAAPDQIADIIAYIESIQVRK